MTDLMKGLSINQLATRLAVHYTSSRESQNGRGGSHAAVVSKPSVNGSLAWRQACGGDSKSGSTRPHPSSRTHCRTTRPYPERHKPSANSCWRPVTSCHNMLDHVLRNNISSTVPSIASTFSNCSYACHYYGGVTKNLWVIRAISK